MNPMAQPRVALCERFKFAWHPTPTLAETWAAAASRRVSSSLPLYALSESASTIRA